MKIYMLWDMEGVSGLHSREQVWHWEAGARAEVVEAGRTLLIDDINTAVQAALEAGADEVIVADTHSGGGNIRMDRMLADSRVTYHERAAVRQPGSDVRLWMQELETCDGLMLMGHHAKAGTEGAFLPHTWTTAWADFRLNGQSVGELGLEACFAAHWNIPLMLVQGDDYTEREVEATYPKALVACVKQAKGRDLCSGMGPEAARALTAERVSQAVSAGPSSFDPFQPRLPMTVSVVFREAEGAEKAALRPDVVRVDAVTVEASVERHCDVVKWILDVGRGSE